MTVEGLSEFFKKRAIPMAGRRLKDNASSTQPLLLSFLKGKKVCIEVQGIVHKQTYAAVQRITHSFPYIYVDNMGWAHPPESDVLDMFKIYFRSFAQKILKSGIVPIFILEGKTPPMKMDTVAARRKALEDRKKEFESMKKKTMRSISAISLNEFKKASECIYAPGSSHVAIVKEILSELDITMIQADYEAEGVCAYLVNNPNDSNHCSCALIDDYDIFMYGCKGVMRGLRSLKNLTTSGIDYFEVEGYSFSDILETLGLISKCSISLSTPIQSDDEIAIRRFQLICALSSNDYHEGVYGWGPAKIYKLIMKHNIHTYEQICTIEPKFSTVPYQEILGTLKINMGYTLYKQ